jgi:hypothetical protein
MATIKLGPLVQDLRGKLVNQVFGVWKAGTAYVRAAANVIANPNSAEQLRVRATLEAFAKLWLGLTAEQKTAWENVGQNNPRYYTHSNSILSIIKGSKAKQISGENAMIQANVLAKSVGATTPILTPAGAVPAAPPDIVVAFVAGTMTVTWGDVPNATADDYVRIFIASKQKKFHDQEVGYALATAKTFSASKYIGAKGGEVSFTIIAGKEILVQLDTVNKATGFASMPSQTVLAVIA